jgi:hypothetical protein
MRLTGIDANGSQGLVFRFDDRGVGREWAFESASLAEFMALLLDGGLREGGKVELPPAAVALAAKPGQPAQLAIALPKLELSLPLSDCQLKTMRDAIDCRLAAENAPQQGHSSGGGHRQMATGITSSPKGRRSRLN